MSKGVSLMLSLPYILSDPKDVRHIPESVLKIKPANNVSRAMVNSSAPLDGFGEDECRLHRVGAALFAIAGVLVWLNFAGEVTTVIHADGGGD